jgi:CRISPR/Cas system-associated protein endoribonuclease Cas2
LFTEEPPNKSGVEQAWGKKKKKKKREKKRKHLIKNEFFFFFFSFFFSRVKLTASNRVVSAGRFGQILIEPRRVAACAA